MKRPAVFIDRDGTLNVDKHYLSSWDQWEWIEGSFEALRLLKQAGFSLVLVSNQSGISRGLFSVSDVEKLHTRLQEELERQGLRFDGIYYCPHSPSENPPCSCRKPRPGMIHTAARELHLSLEKSFMVGDKSADVEAGLAAGVQPLLVLTGEGVIHQRTLSPSIPVVANLLVAVDWILQRQSS